MQITAGVVGVHVQANLVNLDRTLPGTDKTTIPLNLAPRKTAPGHVLNIRMSKRGKISRVSRLRQKRGGQSAVASALS